MPETPLFLAGQRLPAGDLQDLSTPWTPYTPELTASTTDPSLGTGTATGEWKASGDLVFFHAAIKFGATGASAGAGAYFVSLPVPAASTDRTSFFLTGTGELIEAGVNQHRALLRLQSQTTVQLGYALSPISLVTATAPFAFGANDGVIVDGIYRAAP